MSLPYYNWSHTAASNAPADATVNWAEGQSPSSVNDSARAMMASAAAHRDDIAGAITTGGTSTAYTVASYQIFDSLTHLNGQMIAFTPHVTNGGACTLNVDGLGAGPVRQFRNIDLGSGVLVAGTPYVVRYDATSGEYNLHSSFGPSPYLIPLGGMIDFIGATAPNSSLALPFGQAINRTTYATLFALVGTTYGVGDGSTTFNVPDLRGRVIAGKDDMGGSAASRLSSTSITTGGATTLGGSGGAETKTLVTGNLPPYTPAGTITGTVTSPMSIPMRSPGTTGTVASGTVSVGVTGGTDIGNSPMTVVSGGVTGTITGTAQGGASTPVVTMPPVIIANKLLRII